MYLHVYVYLYVYVYALRLVRFFFFSCLRFVAARLIVLNVRCNANANSYNSYIYTVPYIRAGDSRLSGLDYPKNGELPIISGPLGSEITISLM